MPNIITFQVSDVHKTLMNITQSADAGYECHLNAKGGWLLDTFTGGKSPIAREGNLYIMRAWIKGSPQCGFCKAGLNSPRNNEGNTSRPHEMVAVDSG